MNNASHILDLLLWYFEDVSFENVILRYPKTDDDYGIDCRLFVDEKKRGIAVSASFAVKKTLIP